LGLGQDERFFHEYNEGIIFHLEKKLEKPEDRHEWLKGINQSLLSLDRDAFLAGNPKAVLLFVDSCDLCKDCAEERTRCNDKRSARPTPEAMAVDVFSTVRPLCYPIQVLRDYLEI
jgi:predicted metal-binding protein